MTAIITIILALPVSVWATMQIVDYYRR